ncbi:hypothetical protein Hanom_Chr13g01212391 [Helianthus anomalus]
MGVCWFGLMSLLVLFATPPHPLPTTPSLLSHPFIYHLYPPSLLTISYSFTLGSTLS